MNPEHFQPVAVTAAVMTVSSSRTPDTDTSGSSIIELLKKSGISVAYYNIVPDNVTEIRRELMTAMQKSNCIILSGGTGLTHDDCTIEAVLPLLDKKMDGFGELFRQMSYKDIGTSTILSRALGGICQGKAIFCIPGSQGAASLATKDLIIPEIGHILTHANK